MEGWDVLKAEGVEVGGRRGREPANIQRLQPGTRVQHGGDQQGLCSDQGPDSRERAAGGGQAVWVDGDTQDKTVCLPPPTPSLPAEIMQFGGKGTPHMADEVSGAWQNEASKWKLRSVIGK